MFLFLLKGNYCEEQFMWEIGSDMNMMNNEAQLYINNIPWKVLIRIILLDRILEYFMPYW